jgi:hypothetical protein
MKCCNKGEKLLNILIELINLQNNNPHYSQFNDEKYLRFRIKEEVAEIKNLTAAEKKEKWLSLQSHK